MDSSTKCNGDSSYNWRPDDIISKRFTAGNGHVCLVLNREIRIPATVAKQLWQNAYLRCTVDGGTNCWLNFLNKHCQGEHMKPPDLITGDFDSITNETFQYFNDTTVTKRLHTPDENYTDFTKAIKVVRPLLEEKQLNDIIVFHDTSGRFDQIMANINTLYNAQSSTLHVYLISGNSLTWLLRPGKHSIRIPHNLVEEQRWCALIPVGEPALDVTTCGLKWNLTNGSMEFGGLVSTSNTYAMETEIVEIETKTTLVWSMGLFSFDDDS